jgi:hypothetical protein
MRAIPYLSLESASDLLRSRRLSPLDLTLAMLDRIETLDPKLCAYITVATDRALEQARLAEQQIAAGSWIGPDRRSAPLGGTAVACCSRFSAGNRLASSSPPSLSG